MGGKKDAASLCKEKIRLFIFSTRLRRPRLASVSLDRLSLVAVSPANHSQGGVTKPPKLSNTVRVSRSGTSSCIRCGLKLNTERNNRGIDELKAGDVTNNIFGTERYCWSRWPGRAPPQACPPLLEMSAVGRVAALRGITFCHEPAGGSGTAVHCNPRAPTRPAVNQMTNHRKAESLGGGGAQMILNLKSLGEPQQSVDSGAVFQEPLVKPEVPPPFGTNQFRFF